MFPLKAYLIGCSNEVLHEVRRELGNLTVLIDAEFTDIRSALTALSAPLPEKRLFLVQPKSADEIKQLARLNEVFAGQPILAMVDPGADPTILLHAMRAGAAQVVRLPLDADDFQSAVRRIAVQFGSPSSPSRIVTICGALEGAGATSIAINLADELGRRHPPCIVSEDAGLYSGLGKLAIYLEIKPRLTLRDLLIDREHLSAESMRNALVKVNEHLSVLAGPTHRAEPVAITRQEVARCTSLFRQLAGTLVFDLAYTYDELFFERIGLSDQLVIVAQQSVASINSLKQLLEELEQRHSLAVPFVVINRFDPSLEDFEPERLREMLKVPAIYTVREDRTGMLAAQNKGQLLSKECPHSTALADISALADGLLGINTPHVSHRKSWLNWLRSK